MSEPVGKRERSKSGPKALKPFDTKDIKILLLEGPSQLGVNLLKANGYQVEYHAKALPKDTLIDKIKDVHAIGIRSKTKLTEEVLSYAKNLLVIGCFCIGTNQVDLQFASSRGIAVFNSPFSNSRSVAELVLGLMIALARNVTDLNTGVHDGDYRKRSENAHEVRGKKLGIIGYGHIGSQLSVLADSFGIQVFFFDVSTINALGTAVQLPTLEAVLSTCDFISLHVPELPTTKNMIGEKEIKCMKKGSFLINASRGTVVDIPALADALKSGHLAGAAVDVFPSEPLANGPGFKTPLQGCPNVILTPHIGGSTEEAQSGIGVEVSTALVKYINTGCTLGSVNFPEVDVKAPTEGSKVVRLLNVHQNVPGVLKQINKAISEYNVEKQICDSKDTVGYLMADITVESDADLRKMSDAMNGIKEGVKTRILF
ncbi:hypothetical protein HK098_002571 [Nowakowskiella sp. JEL0407]|nr:hypothetical protein HK098_002571 [Nowakowskiella sp. JEL0407]